MPKELFPFSCECDFGHQSHFSENAIREIKALSAKRDKKMYLKENRNNRNSNGSYLKRIDL